MNEENNGNKTLLWVIAIVNILTLIVLAVFFAMSWDVINSDAARQETLDAESQTENTDSAKRVIREEPEQKKETAQQEQLNQKPADKPVLDNNEEECIDKCVQGGKIPPVCAKECGIELPTREDGNNAQGKCGDGACDEVEKNNIGICPKDCQ